MANDSHKVRKQIENEYKKVILDIHEKLCAAGERIKECGNLAVERSEGKDASAFLESMNDFWGQYGLALEHLTSYLHNDVHKKRDTLEKKVQRAIRKKQIT